MNECETVYHVCVWFKTTRIFSDFEKVGDVRLCERRIPRPVSPPAAHCIMRILHNNSNFGNWKIWREMEYFGNKLDCSSPIHGLLHFEKENINTNLSNQPTQRQLMFSRLEHAGNPFSEIYILGFFLDRSSPASSTFKNTKNDFFQSLLPFLDVVSNATISKNFSLSRTLPLK